MKKKTRTYGQPRKRYGRPRKRILKQAVIEKQKEVLKKLNLRSNLAEKREEN